MPITSRPIPARLALLLVLALAALLLGGCSEPLPAERLHYAGTWRGGDTLLQITPAGRVVYVVRRDSGMNKSIKAPLLRFEGDSFIVGAGPVKTTFVVSRPPQQQDGVWKMTVDGVELTRSP